MELIQTSFLNHYHNSSVKVPSKCPLTFGRVFLHWPCPFLRTISQNLWKTEDYFTNELPLHKLTICEQKRHYNPKVDAPQELVFFPLNYSNKVHNPIKDDILSFDCAWSGCFTFVESASGMVRMSSYLFMVFNCQLKLLGKHCCG